MKSRAFDGRTQQLSSVGSLSTLGGRPEQYFKPSQSQPNGRYFTGNHREFNIYNADNTLLLTGINNGDEYWRCDR